jgi:hypothetical protein
MAEGPTVHSLVDRDHSGEVHTIDDHSKALKDYKKARKKLVEMGEFKKRDSKWNQYLKEHYPIVKADIMRQYQLRGEPLPTSRQLFTMASQILSVRYKQDL